MTMKILLAGALAYLMGSVSFGVLVSRLAYRDDIRRHGSGNAGMTNALRVYGGKTAAVVFAGDFLKGVLAVVLGTLIAGPEGRMLAAVAVVIGHLFPVFFGFKGGKGVATGAGAILALNPLALCILAVPFLLILATTRYMSLAAITVAALLPVVTAATLLLPPGRTMTTQGWWELITALVIGGLVVFMHRSNIGRLRAGT